MNATQVSAQGFLKKLKDKGAKMVKEMAPKEVQDVVNVIGDVTNSNTGVNRRSNQTTNKNRNNQRARTNTNRSSSTRTQTFKHNV